MAKYHINGRGEPGACSARAGNCPFGDEASHYASPREAINAYEAAMRRETLPKPSSISSRRLTSASQFVNSKYSQAHKDVGDSFLAAVIADRASGVKDSTTHQVLQEDSDERTQDEISQALVAEKATADYYRGELQVPGVLLAQDITEKAFDLSPDSSTYNSARGNVSYRFTKVYVREGPFRRRRVKSALVYYGNDGVAHFLTDPSSSDGLWDLAHPSKPPVEFMGKDQSQFKSFGMATPEMLATFVQDSKGILRSMAAQEKKRRIALEEGARIANRAVLQTEI